ncbi:MAG: hypothetical protein WCP10_02175 [Desulfuromonadales bacterium]
MLKKLGRFSSGVKEGARVMLNASGAALVSMYDKSANSVSRLRSTVLPTEQHRLEQTVRENTAKIHSLQWEIGMARTRKFEADSADDLELRANIVRVQDCENRIAEMKTRLAEIDVENKNLAAIRKAAKQNMKTAPASTAPPVEPPSSTSAAYEESAEILTTPAAAGSTPERSDTVRVIGRRSKKETTASDESESMAA